VEDELDLLEPPDEPEPEPVPDVFTDEVGE
jgi:hypothetical protein